MTTHILPFTYAPKIEAVKAGTCRQTIRRFKPERPKYPGDKLILHTWAGKQYRSAWDWWLETTIKDVERISFNDGMFWSHTGPLTISEVVDLARRDGIEPPSQGGLVATLIELNGLTNDSFEGTQWEVIRW